MNPSIVARARPVVLAALLALLSLLLVPSTPVAAHTALESSVPAAGERLAVGPAEVELRFTSGILDLGAELQVIGPDGTDWVDGGPQLTGSQARAALRESLSEGRYELRWQVVAEDGHPISGIVPFAVGDAALEPTTTPATADSAGTDTNAATGNPGGRTLLIAVGGAVAALAALWLVTTVRRGRHQQPPAAPEDS